MLKTIGQDRLPWRGQSINDSEVSVKPVAIHVTEEHVALVELLKDEGADLITLIERLVAMNK